MSAKANPIRLASLAWASLFPKDRHARRVAAWKHGTLPRVPITDIFPAIHNTDVNLVRAFDRLPGTSLDVYEITLLAAIVRVMDASNILEIGTFDGNTALNLAVNTPAEARITTVDLPRAWDGQLALEIPKSSRNVTDRSRLGLQYRDTPYAEKIRQVLADSATLDWSSFQKPFDLAFIDGCHHYEYVKSDTRNVRKCLKPGGVLVWHDYGESADVSRAVDEAATEMPVKAVSGTRFAIGINTVNG